jgi:hypothetical protein
VPEILVVHYVMRTTRHVVTLAINSRNCKLFFGQIHRTLEVTWITAIQN